MRYFEIVQEGYARQPLRPLGDTLYHGTGCLNAASMLASKTLKASADSYGAGVSMTDELSSAQYFAERTDAESWDFILHQKSNPGKEYYEDRYQSTQNHPHLTGVVFEFDAAKLAERYKIKPIAYTGDWEDEAEWRVMTTAIFLDDGALRKLHVKPGVVDWWMENMPQRGKALRALLNNAL